MKKLFLVFAKLLGLLLGYYALAGITQMLGYLPIMLDGPGQGWRHALILISVLLYITLSLDFVWPLLFRTEWLAGKIGIPADTPIEGLERVPALIVGTSLIGIHLAARGLPQLASALLTLQNNWSSLPATMIMRSFLPVFLQLILGLFLALKPGAVATLLTRKSTSFAAP